MAGIDEGGAGEEEEEIRYRTMKSAIEPGFRSLEVSVGAADFTKAKVGGRCRLQLKRGGSCFDDRAAQSRSALSTLRSRSC